MEQMGSLLLIQLRASEQGMLQSGAVQDSQCSISFKEVKLQGAIKSPCVNSRFCESVKCGQIRSSVRLAASESQVGKIA